MGRMEDAKDAAGDDAEPFVDVRLIRVSFPVIRYYTAYMLCCQLSKAFHEKRNVVIAYNGRGIYEV